MSSKVATASARVIKSRLLQNFLLIWLDVNIDESNNEVCRTSITELRRFFNSFETFTHLDECVAFLSETKAEKTFLVVSNVLGEQIVPLIHDLTQLHSIYIFCSEKYRHEQWTKKWSKVKGIFTEIDRICQILQQAARHYDHDCMPISFVSTDDISIISKTKNLDQLEPTFMYTQLFKEIFLEIDYNEIQALDDFVAYVHEQFKDNPSQLETIEKFKRDFHKHTPIWWYTCEYFLYSMLNRALRIFDVDTILKMGFFICHLHRQIVVLHREQSSDCRMISTVYRGQGLAEADFAKLEQSKGGLVSFNNFLSTSTDREVSFAFADSSQYNPNSVGILFEITIDQSTSSTSFANIDNTSYYMNEQEVLFSMHTVFRIGEISQMTGNTRLWQVNLTLTSDSDPQLSELTALMHKETSGSTGWHRLGQLLIKVGNFDKVEELYRVLLDQAKDDSDRALLYHHLGYAKKNQGAYQEAISFYEKTIEMYEQTSLNHPLLASSYNNIGLVFMNMSEYSKALSFYNKALELWQQTLSPTDILLATSYSNIGLVHNKMGDYSKALSFYEKALELNQNILPPNHPNFATFHNNIAGVYYNMGEYAKALSFYEKALEIYQKTLPPNHPSLTTSYNNIGAIYKNMCEYAKALLFYEKALEIRQKTLSSDHPDLATSYNNIGGVYKNMGECSKALSFYEKALEIRQKILPPNHSSLATSYNNIAVVYDNMGEYVKALSFFEKALEIDQNILSPNHPSLITSYNNIGAVYDNTGKYTKALSCYEKALEICQKALPPNHPHLAGSYNNIGAVYRNMGEYLKAVSFYEKALTIFQRTLPDNHPHLAVCRRNLESAMKNL